MNTYSIPCEILFVNLNLIRLLYSTLTIPVQILTDLIFLWRKQFLRLLCVSNDVLLYWNKIPSLNIFHAFLYFLNWWYGDRMTTETSYNKLILQNESSFRRSYLLSLNVVYIIFKCCIYTHFFYKNARRKVCWVIRTLSRLYF